MCGVWAQCDADYAAHDSNLGSCRRQLQLLQPRLLRAPLLHNGANAGEQPPAAVAVGTIGTATGVLLLRCRRPASVQVQQGDAAGAQQ
jgi:hypothetical protein